MAAQQSDLQDYLQFRARLVEEMNGLDPATWHKIHNHFRIAPRISEQLLGDGDVTVRQLERKARIVVRQTEDHDEIIHQSNIDALSYIVNFLSADLNKDFRDLCSQFEERAENRGLLRVVDLGLQKNSKLLKTIAFSFMNSDLFPKESQEEFRALAEILKIKSQIRTLESIEKEEAVEEKFSLTESEETFRHPSERSYDLVRKFQKPIFEAEFFYDREDTWVVGYMFDELADGSKVKEGDTITLEDAEKVLQERMNRSAFAVNCLTHPIKLNQNQIDALCSFYLNIGIQHFANSTLLKLLKKDPSDPNIRTEFRRWKYQRKAPQPGEERVHVICPTLVERRYEESELYFE